MPSRLIKKYITVPITINTASIMTTIGVTIIAMLCDDADGLEVLVGDVPTIKTKSLIIIILEYIIYSY